MLDVVSRFQGYAPALLGLVVAVGAHRVWIFFAGQKPSAIIFAVYLIELLFGGWCGYGPGVAVIFLAAFVAPYAVKPNFSFREVDPLGLVVLLSISFIVSRTAASRRRAESVLQDANTELDTRVRQQTAQLKQADTALEQKVAELETLYAKLPVGVCLIDNHLRYVRVNDKLAAIHGVPVYTFLGRGIREILPARLADLVEQLCQSVFETGEAILGKELRDPLPPTPGEERVWLLDCARVVTDHGEVLGLQMIVQDISERKVAEGLLRRQSELINLSHDAIITTSLDRAILGWSAGAAEMYGWTEEEALGKITHQVFQTVAVDPVSTAEVDRVLQLEGRWEGELIHTKCDGEQIVVDSRHVLMRGVDGTPGGVLEINRNITEAKRAHEEIQRLNADLERRVRDRTAQLEALNKELESFAYSVSHNLRAPLRGIDGWSNALLEDYGGGLDETAHRYLNRVLSETQHMGVLIDDLLQLSRVTRMPLTSNPVDLTTMADRIAQRLREDQPQRELEFVIEPGLWAAGDERLLRIALTNLFDNAVKFTRPREKAKIQFGQIIGPGEPVFFVQDNGVGFDMAHSKILFGAFQRLHKANEFPGTGIGLATVQRVLQRHGWNVWADAKPDHGATFYFGAQNATEPLDVARAEVDVARAEVTVAANSAQLAILPAVG